MQRKKYDFRLYLRKDYVLMQSVTLEGVWTFCDCHRLLPPIEIVPAASFLRLAVLIYAANPSGRKSSGVFFDTDRTIPFVHDIKTDY